MHEIKVINISAYDPFNPYPAKVENMVAPNNASRRQMGFNLVFKHKVPQALSNLNFHYRASNLKFQCRTSSLLDEKYGHLKGQHFPIGLLKLNATGIDMCACPCTLH